MHVLAMLTTASLLVFIRQHFLYNLLYVLSDLCTQFHVTYRFIERRPFDCKALRQSEPLGAPRKGLRRSFMSRIISGGYCPFEITGVIN